MHVERMDAVKWLEIRRGLQSLLTRHVADCGRPGRFRSDETNWVSVKQPETHTHNHTAPGRFFRTHAQSRRKRSPRHRDTEDAHRGAGALQVKSLVKSLHARGSRGERRNGSRRLRSRGVLLLCSYILTQPSRVVAHNLRSEPSVTSGHERTTRRRHGRVLGLRRFIVVSGTGHGGVAGTQQSAVVRGCALNNLNLGREGLTLLGLTI